MALFRLIVNILMNRVLIVDASDSDHRLMSGLLVKSEDELS